MVCAVTAKGLWETKISQVIRCGQKKKKKVGWCAHSHMHGWEKYLRIRPQVPEKSALGIDPSTGHTIFPVQHSDSVIHIYAFFFINIPL